MNIIAVSEIFGPTIQGEGITAGKPVIFLRLTGCNLACIWCDTPFTWNWVGTKFQHPDKYLPKNEVKKFTSQDLLIKLLELGSDVKALVISGGEPFLQQKKMINLVRALKNRNWWIEIETNGTIMPDKEFVSYVDQINCSPKLKNSGPDNEWSLRIKPFVLKELSFNPKTAFKFVVQSSNDIDEILDLVNEHQMDKVYLMPEGRTKEEQIANRDAVIALCDQYGFNYSPRLHVLKWGDIRGV